MKSVRMAKFNICIAGKILLFPALYGWVKEMNKTEWLLT